MKKVVFIMVLVGIMLTSSVQLQANPLIPSPPEFFVSELTFDAEGNWVIDLGSNGWWHFDFLHEDVDSVCIITSCSRAKINLLSFSNVFSGIISLSNDHLDSDLTIKQTGDYIQITIYYKYPQWYYGEEPVDSISHTLVFGNYVEATVRSPKENESIVFRSRDFYCINKTPTIGLPKSDNGTYATVRFKISYPDKQPFTASVAQLSDNNNRFFIDLVRDPDGIYSGRVHHCFYHIDKMYVRQKTGNTYYGDHWLLRSFELPKDWDVWYKESSYFVIELDQFVDINLIQVEETILKIFPNPITENSFYYETALPVKAASSMIEIIGLNGQKVGHYPIFENKGKITLSPDIVAGVYTVRLVVNKKNYATTKMIVR